jgi:lysophosphatidylcholine acyltransferase/lyso-PAF acetyltransferase
MVACIITIGLDDEDLKQKPLSGWRRVLRGVLRVFGRSIAFCCGFLKIRKIGTRATRLESTVFVAAPHSSFFDAFVIIILGLPSGLSRAENAKFPLLGRLVKSVQPILVNRNDTKNKQATIDEVKRRADPNSDWPQVIVFPEGTTTNRTCLISFKPGAFIPGLPVQPVCVQYKNRRDTITWTWQGLSAMKCFFLSLCQLYNRLQVTVKINLPSGVELICSITAYN